MSTMLAALASIPEQVPVPDVDTSGPKSFINSNLWLLLAAGGAAYIVIRMWRNAALRTLMIVVGVALLTFWFVQNYT